MCVRKLLPWQLLHAPFPPTLELMLTVFGHRDAPTFSGYASGVVVQKFPLLALTIFRVMPLASVTLMVAPATALPPLAAL
jgi:hypothetical protein